MEKILLITIIGLLVYASAFIFVENLPVEEITPTQEDYEKYSQKEIVYVPLDCVINETSYDIKCYEESLNGFS